MGVLIAVGFAQFRYHHLKPEKAGKAMSDESKRRQDNHKTTLIIAGALRVAVMVTLSWALAIILTPPNEPVENGLEVVFPGVVILFFFLPSALAGIALMRHGVEAVHSAKQTDVLSIILVAGVALLFWTPWITFAALPFVADLAFLRAFGHKHA